MTQNWSSNPLPKSSAPTTTPSPSSSASNSSGKSGQITSEVRRTETVSAQASLLSPSSGDGGSEEGQGAPLFEDPQRLVGFIRTHKDKLLKDRDQKKLGELEKALDGLLQKQGDAAKAKAKIAQLVAELRIASAIRQKEDVAAPYVDAQAEALGRQAFQLPKQSSKGTTTKKGDDGGSRELLAGDHVFNNVFEPFQKAFEVLASGKADGAEAYAQRLTALRDHFEVVHRGKAVRAYELKRKVQTDANSRLNSLVSGRLQEVLKSGSKEGLAEARRLAEVAFSDAAIDREAYDEVAKKDGGKKLIDAALQYMQTHKKVVIDAIETIMATQHKGGRRLPPEELAMQNVVAALKAKGKPAGYDLDVLVQYGQHAGNEAFAALMKQGGASEVVKQLQAALSARMKKPSSDKASSDKASSNKASSDKASSDKSPKPTTTTSSDVSSQPSPKPSTDSSSQPSPKPSPKPSTDSTSQTSDKGSSTSPSPSPKKESGGSSSEQGDKGKSGGGGQRQARALRFAQGMNLLQDYGHFHLLLDGPNQQVVDIDVPGDGSCFFHSVGWGDVLLPAWQVFKQQNQNPDGDAIRQWLGGQVQQHAPGHGARIQGLRSQIAGHLRQNRAQYLERIQHELTNAINLAVLTDNIGNPDINSWHFEGLGADLSEMLRQWLVGVLPQEDPTLGYEQGQILQRVQGTAALIDGYIVALENDPSFWGGAIERDALNEVRNDQPPIAVHLPAEMQGQQTLALDVPSGQRGGGGGDGDDKGAQGDHVDTPKFVYTKMGQRVFSTAEVQAAFEKSGWKRGQSNDNVMECDRIPDPLELHASLVGKNVQGINQVEFVMRSKPMGDGRKEEQLRATSVRWWYDIKEKDGQVRLEFSGNVGGKDDAAERQLQSDENEAAYVRFLRATKPKALGEMRAMVMSLQAQLGANVSRAKAEEASRASDKSASGKNGKGGSPTQVNANKANANKGNPNKGNSGKTPRK